MLHREREERNREAARAFEQAESEPGPVTFYNRGGAELANGRYEDAARDFEQAVALAPGFAEAWAGLGNARAVAGDVEGAIEAYRRTIEVRPNFIPAYASLGLLHFMRQEWREAVEVYEKGLALDRLDPVAHANLAAAYLRLGDPDKAIEAGLGASLKRPEFSQAYGVVCAAYAAKGDTASARAYCEKALELGAELPEEIRKDLLA